MLDCEILPRNLMIACEAPHKLALKGKISFDIMASTELEYSLWQPRFEDKDVIERWEEYTDYGDEEDSSVLLTEEEIVAAVAVSELQQKFNEASGEGETITSEDAVKLCRTLGFAPDDGSMARAKAETNDRMTFSQFEEFLKSSTHPEDSQEYLAKMFASFDKEKKGFLPKAAMKNILKSYGEPLDTPDIDGILAAYGDPVDYHMLAQAVLSKD
eukprot:Polyplicarium_translucidae@DN251_c0_g1_i2.p2